MNLPQTRGNRSPYRIKGQTYTVLPTADDYVEEGIASWYGMKFHGRQTAMATFTMCSLLRRPIDHCRFKPCAGDQSPQPADSGAPRQR